jgi:hypothetical protein
LQIDERREKMNEVGASDLLINRLAVLSDPDDLQHTRRGEFVQHLTNPDALLVVCESVLILTYSAARLFDIRPRYEPGSMPHEKWT